MTAKNHVVTTITVVLIPIIFNPSMLSYLSVDNFALILSGVIFGSLLPDIDEPNSYIGRKVAFFSEIANSSVGHRTITHNLFVWILFGLYGYYFLNYFIIGMSIGAMLHILEDSATNSGVKWALKPLYTGFAILPKRFRFNTNGKFENYVYTPIITVIVVGEIALLLMDLFGFVDVSLRS